ncbi:MAG: Gfo/Idh/MocA family oxidoreductase [Chloroflexi bacterium]|nr:Gfo/Idh/MocA family oxidoreductase [Chloroflexota bacterium]
MAEIVGIGIIGTGTIAQSHLRTLQQTPQAKVVAVYDVLTDRAEATAKQFAIPNVAKTLEEMLAREAGKHVLCEKPFALDPAEAERMVRTSERVGRFLACASARNRYGMGPNRARQMLDAGELGDVYHVRSTSFRFRGRPGHHIFPQSAWFLDRQRAGGGVIMDFAVYTIDLVLWLLGNPKVNSVSAQMRQIVEEPPAGGVKQDVEDHVALFMQCEGGKAGIVEASWVANMDDADGLIVLGTKAGLRFDPLRKVTPVRVEVPPERRMGVLGEDTYVAHVEKAFPFEFPQPPGFGPDITKHFVEAIAQGRQPMTPGRDALEVTRVIDAAFRSAREQRVVALA